MATANPGADYASKGRSYFNVDRHDLFQLIPDDRPGRVLEIGAAEGSMLVALKQSGKAREVVGVELMAIPGAGQSRPEIDRFIIGDIEQQNLDLEPASFDVLICGDVLEHLRDPWSALLYLVGFVKRSGTCVISLPNILYWRASVRILLGDFRYSPSGVLDRTHLRFFCRRNMIDLVRSAGLQILRIEPSFRRHRQLRNDRLLNALTLGLGERFLAQQYLIVAAKSDQAASRETC
jgi:2-polyprenyl-3-methyl-5-hydroxy-6-metoxy-1,4-benzoquinol methylase